MLEMQIANKINTHRANCQNEKSKQNNTQHANYQNENIVTNKSTICQALLSWKMLNLKSKRCMKTQPDDRGLIYIFS